MTDDEIIAVVQAHKEGKKIQGKAHRLSNVWIDLVVEPITWDFLGKEYRVVPEPNKPREWYAAVFKDGSGSLYLDPEWAGQVYKGSAAEIIRVREIIEDHKCNCGFPDQHHSVEHYPYCNSLKK